MVALGKRMPSRFGPNADVIERPMGLAEVRREIWYPVDRALVCLGGDL